MWLSQRFFFSHDLVTCEEEILQLKHNYFTQQNNAWWSAHQRRNEYSCLVGYLYRHDMFNKISFVWQHHYQELNSAFSLFTWDRPLHEMRYFTLPPTTKCGLQINWLFFLESLRSACATWNRFKGGFLVRGNTWLGQKANVYVYDVC